MIAGEMCACCRRFERLHWHGVQLCPMCDQPPGVEGVWFLYWRYADPAGES